MTFVVFALPRSRTAWLSRFLTYGEWTCGHEEVRHFRGMDDVQSWLAQPCTGTVETAAASWWRFLQGKNVRVVTVRRPVEECVASLMRLPIAFDAGLLRKTLMRADRKLDQIEARLPGVLSVQFDSLASENGCCAVFEHCLPYEHDPDWWAVVSAQNLQVNTVAVMRYYMAHAPQLQRLGEIARTQTIAAIEGRRRYDMEGFTFQQEGFDTFYRDGARLMERHLASLNERPGDYRLRNADFARFMDQMGSLHITTARCNGRMFGYLMAVVGPSLDTDALVARQSYVYAESSVPGLGMRLHREALNALRERGVGEIFYVAGTAHPRMGAIYRRLGAAVHAQQFRLMVR